MNANRPTMNQQRKGFLQKYLPWLFNARLRQPEPEPDHRQGTDLRDTSISKRRAMMPTDPAKQRRHTMIAKRQQRSRQRLATMQRKAARV